VDLPVGTPDKPFPFRDSIARAEFALNETMILAISESGIIRIWDISTLPKGDLRDVACSKYNEHDVFDFARRYGIKDRGTHSRNGSNQMVACRVIEPYSPVPRCDGVNVLVVTEGSTFKGAVGYDCNRRPYLLHFRLQSPTRMGF
jgi:hypothetical protein